MGCSQSKAKDVIIEPTTASSSECGLNSFDLAFTEIMLDDNEATNSSISPPKGWKSNEEEHVVAAFVDAKPTEQLLDLPAIEAPNVKVVEIQAVVAMNEPIAVVEPVRVDQPIAVVELDQPIPANESIEVDELIKVDQPVPANESIAVNEPVRVDQPATANEFIAVDELVRVDQPIPSDLSTAVDEPVRMDQPVAENESISIKVLSSENRVVIEAEQAETLGELAAKKNEDFIKPKMEAEDIKEKLVEISASSVDNTTASTTNITFSWMFVANEVSFTIGVAYYNIVGYKRESEELLLTKRYSEFKLLHAEMAKIMSGEELPSMPGTSFLQGRNDKNVLHEREKIFVEMLNTIALHPLASQSAYFTAFLK